MSLFFYSKRNFNYNFYVHYSVLKLFTGLAIAALIAWKLMVANAIKITKSAADANIHLVKEMRYG